MDSLVKTLLKQITQQLSCLVFKNMEPLKIVCQPDLSLKNHLVKVKLLWIIQSFLRDIRHRFKTTAIIRETYQSDRSNLHLHIHISRINNNSNNNKHSTKLSQIINQTIQIKCHLLLIWAKENSSKIENQQLSRTTHLKIMKCYLR
jgi:hypothetical protein